MNTTTNTAMQIITGFMIGCFGFAQIPNNPGDGWVVLRLGGLMILSSIEQFFAPRRHVEAR